MGTKIVLDTNVIISAFRYGGTPYNAMQKIIINFEIIISNEQLNELERTLHYPKLNLSKENISELMQFIKATFTIVKINKPQKYIKEDPSDDIILQTAIENKAYILTGDKHLLKLNNNKIMTPREFLDKLQ